MKNLPQFSFSFARVVATLVLCSTIRPALAEEEAMVYQFELALGAGRPVSSIYVSSWSGNEGIGFDSRAPSMRFPLYSTDPKIPSMQKSLSALMNAEESDGGGFRQLFAALLGLTLYVGVPVYGLIKSVEEAYDFEIDQITPVVESDLTAVKTND